MRDQPPPGTPPRRAALEVEAGSPAGADGRRAARRRTVSESHTDAAPRDSSSWLCSDELWAALSSTGEASLRALMIVFLLTASFTVAQLIGAYIANSLSMFGDCVTMAVDALTYLLNITAEMRKVSQRKILSLAQQEEAALAIDLLDARVALLSGFMLIGVTVYILYDAGKRLHSELGVDPVNPQIMYSFSAGNLVMNMLSCYGFCRRPRAFGQEQTGEYDRSDLELLARSRVAEPLVDDEVAPHELGSAPHSRSASGSISSAASYLDARRQSSSSTRSSVAFRDEALYKENLNMFSAFVHLAADTLRSITVFVTSVYVWSIDGDSVQADAISSVIVCTLILVAATYLIYESSKRIFELRARTGNSFEPIAADG